jgi:uncharacterized protein
MTIARVETLTLQDLRVGRLEYGVDIIEALEAYCASEKITCAWINLLGAVSQAKLAFYTQDTHEYRTHVFSGDYEILNGTGNISIKEGKPFAHIHLTLGDSDYKTIGGHLMKGESCVFACEFSLWVLEGGSLLRGLPDAQTGLALWECPEGN